MYRTRKFLDEIFAGCKDIGPMKVAEGRLGVVFPIVLP